MSEKQVVSKHRDADTGNDNLWFECPGCSQVEKRPPCHRIPVSVGTRRHPGTTHPSKTWLWNGSTTKPTISPSINITGDCHFNITDGKIKFHGDSTHPLAGQTVDMPEFVDF